MSPRSADRLTVNAEGVHFPDTTLPPCDILMDGRRVMSMLPADQEQPENGVALIAWPVPLKARLRGSAKVTVREHASGVVHYDAEVRFSNADQRVRVETASGEPLTVNKWGRLERSFADSKDTSKQVAMTADVLRDINRDGFNGYMAYGTLLGAVRNGQPIGHDTDSDITYLSRYSHPADIARESFALQRALIKRGWEIDRGRWGKLMVMKLHKIDVFVSYFIGGTYCLDQWVEGPLRRDQILPLSTVKLGGKKVPAPADPEGLLALNYGPNWRVPDPAFHYDDESPHLERVKGWFGSISFNRSSWNNYWRLPLNRKRPAPSTFSAWVAARANRNALLLDVACGRGIDTVGLAGQGFTVHGYDYATHALNQARRAAEQLSTNRPTFTRTSLADTRRALAEGAKVACLPGPKTIYARLALDAFTEDGYRNFWHFLRLASARGGDAFFEFRARKGPPLKGSRPPLWRRVVDLDDFTAQVAKIGGTITEHEKVFAKQNPGIRVATHRFAVHFQAPAQQ